MLQACESHAFLIRACEWVWQVAREEARIEPVNCCSTTQDLVWSHQSLPGPALNSAGLFPNRNSQNSLDFLEKKKLFFYLFMALIRIPPFNKSKHKKNCVLSTGFSECRGFGENHHGLRLQWYYRSLTISELSPYLLPTWFPEKKRQ